MSHQQNSIIRLCHHSRDAVLELAWLQLPPQDPAATAGELELELLSSPQLNSTRCQRKPEITSLLPTALECSWQWFSSCYVSRGMRNTGAVPSLSTWVAAKVDPPGAAKFKACCWPPSQHSFHKLGRNICPSLRLGRKQPSMQRLLGTEAESTITQILFLRKQDVKRSMKKRKSH